MGREESNSTVENIDFLSLPISGTTSPALCVYLQRRRGKPLNIVLVAVRRGARNVILYSGALVHGENE